jgi:hypothetical protein
MVRIARELHYDICYHHAQIEDLMRDKDEQRKTAQLSRIKQYAPLQKPPIPTVADLITLGWKQNSEHDKVDNILLFSVKRSAVSFLVTEDRGIHKKAAKAGLSDRVFFTEDFLAYLRNAQRTDGFVSSGPYVSVEKSFFMKLMLRTSSLILYDKDTLTSMIGITGSLKKAERRERFFRDRL